MKQLLFAFLLLSAVSFAQVRVGEDRPITAVTTIPGVTLPVLVAQPAVTVTLCAHPATGVPCTNPVTTYSDSTGATTCPSNAQLTLPGTSSCVSTTDAYGNWGAWMQPGTVDFTVTLLNGTSSGPYTISVGTSSGGGGTVVVPGATGDILASNGASGFQIDTGVFFYDAVTHTLHALAYQSDSVNPFLLTMMPNASPCTAGPAGKTQLCAGPGSALYASYSNDGPFYLSRWGTIGTTLSLPASTFYPLDANSALPLGSLGDVCLVRINPGVMGVINCANTASASKLNAVYQCFTSNCSFGGINWGGDGAVQFFSDKNGSGTYPPMEFCPTGSASCAGWRILGGTATPGVLFPLAANTNPDIGSPSQGQVRNIMQSGALVESGQYTLACTNDATGTQIGLIAKRGTVTDANGNLECETSTTADTTGLVGVVVGESTGGSCGVGSACTTGVAYVAFRGKTTAAFDGSTTAKHYAVASTTTAGNLSDSGIAVGSMIPPGTDIIGVVQGSNTGAGTYAVELNVQSARFSAVSCGTNVACSPTALSAFKIAVGRVSLSSGSPSTAVVTGISPAFTSSSSYQCTVGEGTTASNGLKVTYASGTSFTITGPNTVTDSVSYICIGN